MLLADIDEQVITIATIIRQSKKVSLGDAIIAATALLYNLPLFTNNEEDFKAIQGLAIIPLSSI